MSRTGVGAVLLGAAVMLTSQLGCVSPSGTESKMTELETEVEVLTERVTAAQDATAAAQDATAAAQDATAAAQDATAAAQERAEAAETARNAAAVMAASALEAAAQAQAEADALRAVAPAPGIRVSLEQLDLSRLDLDAAQVAAAGPERIYVSSIRYGGQSYSALLRYQGGTTATVERVFGPGSAMTPDMFDLSRTQLAPVARDTLEVSNVGVAGRGYSGQLRHTGGNELELAGLRQVTLPPGAAEQLTAAQAELAQVRAELAVMMQDAAGRRIKPGTVDFNLLDLDRAQVSVAGPESIYISGIRYGGGGELAARLRYTGASRGVVEELFDTASGALPELDLSVPAVDVHGPETMVISNVGIGGAAYSFTLALDAAGEIVISQQGQGHGVLTAAELLRDELLTAPGVTRVVSRISGGRALPGEGAWTVSAAGVASQTDPLSSHAKYAFEEVPQPAAPTLYGITVRAGGSQKVGYGLHFLASEPPRTGATWNYGRSYLMWATRERDFYGTEATQVQLYESLDGNRLMWLNSRNLQQGLTPGMTLEALYDPADCAESMGMSGEPCYGSITVLVEGREQFKVAVAAEVAGQAADAVALRALGGPVEFTDLYVHRGR